MLDWSNKGSKRKEKSKESNQVVGRIIQTLLDILSYQPHMPHLFERWAHPFEENPWANPVGTAVQVPGGFGSI